MGFAGIGKSVICKYLAWYLNDRGVFKDGIVYIDFGGEASDIY